MRLSDCLAAANWRSLAAIAQSHRLPIGPHPTRAVLVDSLLAELPRRVASLRRSGLAAPAAAALAALAAADGVARLPDFVAVYGDMRSLKGVRHDDPRHLARHPASTTEWLIFHGLAFVVPSEQRGQPPRIVLPDEWLTDFRPPPPEGADTLPAEAGRWPDLSLALTVYLAALRATPPRLAKGGRLPAVALHPIAALLGRPAADPAADWLRLARFLDFLARRLGLTMPLGHRLHPSPLAAAWLDQPSSIRYASLWRAWLDETDLRATWRLYRLPAGDLSDPAAFTHRLLDRLRTVGQPPDAYAWRSLDDLAPAGDPGRLVADLIPWWDIENHPDLGRDLAWQVLRGPLTWLGALEWASPPSHLWRLTTLGAWYLGLDENPPSAPPSPSLHLSVMTSESDSQPLAVALGPALLSLADWLDVKPGPPDAPWPPHLFLSPASVTRGLRRGGDIDDLVRLLTTTIHPAPSETLPSTLRAWATPRAAFRLRPAVLLRAPSESHLDTLLRSRAARRSVTRRLSTTDVEVDPASLPVIRTVLGRLGHALDPAALDTVAPDQPPQQPRLSLGAAELAWLLTSLEGYAAFARRLGLPPPTAALADRLTPHLDPPTQASAQHAAQHAADVLDRTLRDLDPALAPVPTDTLLPLLETAIQDNADIHMRYWTPSRPAPLARTVSPRRIEWRGDTPYLVAYCHLRRDERTFRLDRILAIEPIQSCTAPPA